MKKIILAIGLLTACSAVQAQQEISYEVSFPNAIHHLLKQTPTCPVLLNEK